MLELLVLPVTAKNALSPFELRHSTSNTDPVANGHFETKVANTGIFWSLEVLLTKISANTLPDLS
jgi:hypothetical protein